HPLYSESLRTVSRILIQQGRVADAKPYLLEEYKLLVKLGDEFLDLDFDLYYLAVVEEQRGNLTEAEKLYRKALRIALRYEKDEPTVSHIYAHLAGLLYARDATDQAKYYLSLLTKRILKQSSRKSHVLEELNSVRDDLDRGREAVAIKAPRLNTAYNRVLINLYSLVLQLGEKQWGKASPKYLDTLNDFTFTCMNAHEWKKAKQLAESGLDILQHHSPGDTKRIAKFRYRLAYINSNTGNIDEASRIMKSVLAESSKTDEAWLVRDSALNLTGWMEHKKEYGEARRALDTLDVYARTHGKSEYFDELSQRYERLCSELLDSGDFQAALPALEKANQYPRADAMSRLRSYSLLGHAYFLCNQYAKSQPILERVLSETQHMTSFETSSLRFQAALDLSAIYKKGGQADRAAQILQGSNLNYTIASVEKALGKIGIGDSTALANLNLLYARALMLARRETEAANAYEQCLPRYELGKGKNDEYYMIALESGELHLRLGKYKTARRRLYEVLLRIRDNTQLYCVDTVVKDLKQLFLATGAADREKMLSRTEELRIGELIRQGCALLRAQKLTQSRSYFEKVQAMDARIHGMSSPVYLYDQELLVSVAIIQKDYSEVERICRHYLSNEKSPGHKESSTSIGNCLITALNMTGRASEAEEIAKLFSKRRNHHSIDSLYLYQCATTMLLENREKEAKQYIHKAHERANRHAMLCSLDHWFVKCVEPLRKSHPQKEKLLIEDELTRFKNVDGRETLGVAILTFELGEIYEGENKKEKALELFKQALSIADALEADVPVNKIRILQATERILRTMSRTKEADNCATRIKALEKAIAS
ncbi:MAG: hypothetical protein K2Z81_05935, partial [Cyanobacteria bacterium]|nr:hypothetical protein [Cyanobacteriota bacterium]